MPHFLRRFALGAAGVTTAALGFAVTPGLAQEDRDINCDDAYTQSEMNICAARDYDDADAALNAQWSVTYAAMADYPGAKQTLLEAQRAWLTYRDAQCDAVGTPYEGGSIQPLVIATCLANLTRARTEELQQMLPGETGSGPEG